MLASALGGCARVPDVRSVDDDRLELGPLPGRPPLEVDDRAGPAWERHWERVGACLAALAAAQPSTELPVHDAQREADVTLRWVERAVAAKRLPAADLDEALAPLTRQPAPATTLTHRDLHDGQLLFTDGPPGVLDPDTLARAEPALDLANLLVHLDLRVAQGDLPSDGRERARDAVIRGASPASTTLRRLPSYEQATRLRLSAVYAFRPRWHALARRWFDELIDPARRRGTVA
jgi:aminoglycoside phosphotransferase (APT) family kinase protein